MYMKRILINLSKIDKIILLFFIVIIFSLSGFLLVRTGFYNYDEKEITYSENKDIDYKVYLKPNDFFEEEYLSKNKTYIASLIDYVHVDFSYDIELSDKLSGSYSYYVKGVLEANEENSDNNYYTREYILSDTKTEKYENKKSINIKENIDIDYDTYNDILNSFKDEYNVSMDGNLKVVLVISNMVNNKSLDDEVVKNSELELNIPLTSLTVEVPIDASNKSNAGVLASYKISKEGLFYPIARVLGIICYVVAFISVIYLIYLTIISYRLESIYNKKLRKILKTYDGIIVNLKEMPNINKTKIINVSSFEELIDAHSEIRNPINYVKEKDGSTFLLIFDNYTYCYKLIRELFSKGRDE